MRKIHPDGTTYDPKRDYARLNKQSRRIYKLMYDGKWRTLPEISAETGDPEASVSARLRDLRKEKFGGHTVRKVYIEKGLWSYQLLVTGKGKRGKNNS